MKNKKGFTLMEVMAVVVIIAVLAGVAYPVYTKATIKGRIAEAFALSEIVREAQQRRLALNLTYFDSFTTSDVQGETRLIKATNATVSNGVLKKGSYIVKISDVTGANPVDNGCIIVKYLKGTDESSAIFTIYTHVEDSRIWCEEATGVDGICVTIPAATLEDIATLDCATN
ncbi:MAG: prepilin-type N-terminal cleavage/methylation domain-containing protein [Elusimicrobiaceae bacterium]|nr:prepilin-type N-terminal cleavage/methylation domain-containing protein [Elusimicrobiaceae bacterium]